ncbi:MAG: uncharacterized protein QOE59_1413 [Actinomycetota bacterium]|nr:uncharacterized protein [Actinomycetota bacterium]
MSDLETTTTHTTGPGTGAHAVSDPVDTAPVNAGVDQAAANPALLGVPTFVIGSVALGLYLIGFKSADHALGAVLPVLIFCNGLGLAGATVWAAAVREGPVASIFGIFAAFWISFPVFVLGLTHGWWGISATDIAAATDAKAVFLLVWFVGIVMLTVASLRLPAVFTALFVLVDVALALVYFGTVNDSTGLLTIGGILVFAFAAIGVYLFLDAMGVALGSKPLPMGPPVITR